MFMFSIVPDSLLGTGEAGQDPTAAAIANALRQATGVRLRDLPMSQERVKAAVGV
jgi:nicotinate dehydrogenase subunit B